MKKGVIFLYLSLFSQFFFIKKLLTDESTCGWFHHSFFLSYFCGIPNSICRYDIVMSMSMVSVRLNNGRPYRSLSATDFALIYIRFHRMLNNQPVHRLESFAITKVLYPPCRGIGWIHVNASGILRRIYRIITALFSSFFFRFWHASQ